jgi:hypothetical protein
MNIVEMYKNCGKIPFQLMSDSLEKLKSGITDDAKDFGYTEVYIIVDGKGSDTTTCDCRRRRLTVWVETVPNSNLYNVMQVSVG